MKKKIMQTIAKDFERTNGKIPVCCVSFLVFKFFPGNSITSITLQRNPGERPMESLPPELFERLRTVFKRETYDVAKRNFRGQILILVLLVCIGG